MQSEKDTAEALIFDLRKKADLFLRAGDAEMVNRVQATIATLQHIYGVTKGLKREADDRTC